MTDTLTVFDAKKRLVASFGLSTLFTQLDEAIAALETALRQLTDGKAILDRNRAELSEAETLAWLGVEGKNELERKARHASALKGNVAYQSLKEALAYNEAQIARYADDLALVERRAKRIELEIRAKTAALAALGG